MTSEELKQLEADLWKSADTLRANSDLKASEYSPPVLGLIFLKFADNRYRRYEKEILAEYTKRKGTWLEKKLSEIAAEKCGFYLPDHARYDYLLTLPEKKDIDKAIKKAMEFFTPRSVVRLMVAIIEPHKGKVYNPACGSGGMFVQSAHFIAEQRKEQANGNGDISVYGQEKTLETVKLAKMNLAVNGLRGEIRQANTYYEDPHESFGAFDYVLANPPFNVDDVSLRSVEKDRRFNT